MRWFTSSIGSAFFFVAIGIASAQTQSATIDSYLGQAKIAAGTDWAGTFLRLCIPPPAGRQGGRGEAAPASGRGGPRRTPARETWYAEPAKVADNLYFLGTKIHSAWAIVGSQGIIILEALFDYATRDEILDGLKKVGLDPNRVKYVLLSHAHADHDGGASLLQDSIPGVHLIYGAEDWEAVDQRTGNKPKHDMVGTDGMKVTVGDASVQIVTMPGHTPERCRTSLKCAITGSPFASLTLAERRSPSAPAPHTTMAIWPRPRRWRRPPPITARRSCCRITPNSTTPTSRRKPRQIASRAK